MPRISRDVAAAKESFVLGLFAENPSFTMKEIQTKVKEKYGASMNSNKINQLRGSVTTKGSPIVSNEQPAVEPAPEAVVAATPAEVVTTASTESSTGNENVTFVSVPAPAPVSVAPVEPVLMPVTEVTDSTGTYVKPVEVSETVEKTRTIRPGLVEVVKTEV